MTPEHFVVPHERHHEHRPIMPVAPTAFAELAPHRLVLGVRDMKSPAFEYARPTSVLRPEARGRELSGSGAVVRRGTVRVPVYQADGGIVVVAQARRVFRDRVEHRLNVARRARNDAQNLGGGGLLLQGLGEVTIARLQLLEQPYVLDRDHRLVGEGPRVDLLLREWRTSVR